jgi:methionine synthase I (cobalamin-dependent)
METLLLDGGLGHLLKAVGLIVEHLSYDQQFLASAIANVDRPDLVVDCHSQYLTAGCSVITTNTFVCTPHSLAKIGRGNQLHALLQVRRADWSQASRACMWWYTQQHGPASQTSPVT